MLVPEISGFVPAGVLRSHVLSPRAVSTRPLLGRVGLRMTSASDEAVEKEEEVKAVSKELSAEQLERGPGVPKSESQMIAAASDAVRAAFEDGKTRQKVRFLLPREGKLMPTDEDWPGGIMQLYAACSPLTRAFLRKLAGNEGGIGATCKEQRLDESGVDGESLWIAQGSSPKDDVSAFCQPSGEQLDTIKKVCDSAGPRLVLIVNPQWRETDDSYDQLAQKQGFLGQLANFVGGTSGLKKQISGMGFEDAYLLQQYVVRGDDCQIVKAYPFKEWYAYTEDDSGKVICLGRQAERPTYQDISKMFEDKGVAMRWAREAGIGKKFE
eukprot:CAMPEP_0206236518 /NCGR_PEP_ID=MMETSP0047_2-20121206/13761_1 /ASSEMBLY_ACC=CAM_ASM_000192 /TAXON_ID=195065 /ORGANISM="Chroomonas mesostigmatica_cf, Strain CCMP1168" /LENGTH=324 /DNA_ID=CAMNT_0053660865 /DNA_START=139 /DNA_END=1113 /DNA_ORIENTATION=-